MNPKTIRINEKLGGILDEVPKGISYANWLIDKIERLEAHEQNAICWVVMDSDVGPNRMSVGDRNGKPPILDELIYIVKDVPTTNSSGEEREKGWLGTWNDGKADALGGFASIEAARTYIKEYLGGRLITDQELLDEIFSEYEEKQEVYTTFKFDEWYFIDEWLSEDEPEVKALNDNEIYDLAEKIQEEANEQGIYILGDIEEYLEERRDEWEIECPYCETKHTYDELDDFGLEDVGTEAYKRTGGTRRFYCSECEKEFLVHNFGTKKQYSSK